MATFSFSPSSNTLSFCIFIIKFKHKGSQNLFLEEWNDNGIQEKHLPLWSLDSPAGSDHCLHLLSWKEPCITFPSHLWTRNVTLCWGYCSFILKLAEFLSVYFLCERHSGMKYQPTKFRANFKCHMYYRFGRIIL